MTSWAPRELVTVTAAAARVGRSRSTVRRWHTRGLLFVVGLDLDGHGLVDLAAVRVLAEATPTRRRKRKP